jgi:hypothetical protein
MITTTDLIQMKEHQHLNFVQTADANFASLEAFLRAQMTANGVTEGRGRISKNYTSTYQVAVLVHK